MTISVNDMRSDKIICKKDGVSYDTEYVKDQNNNFIWAKKYDFTIELKNGVKKARIVLKKKKEPSPIGTFTTINMQKDITTQTNCEGFYGDEYEGVCIDPSNPKIFTFKIPENGKIFEISISFIAPIFTIPSNSNQTILVQNPNNFSITINMSMNSYDSNSSLVQSKVPLTLTISANSIQSFIPNDHFNLGAFPSLPTEGSIYINYDIPNKDSGNVEHSLIWNPTIKITYKTKDLVKYPSGKPKGVRIKMILYNYYDYGCNYKVMFDDLERSGYIAGNTEVILYSREERDIYHTFQINAQAQYEGAWHTLFNGTM